MAISIPLTRQREDFARHLADERNQRIIFSGAFGIGKTYFLNDFFQQQQEYLAVRLSPVNYSISANDDIFQLVKYDILVELVAAHGLEFQTDVISREVAYGTLLAGKAQAVVDGLLQFAPLLNKDTATLTAVWTGLKALLPVVQEVEAARHDPHLQQRVLDFEKLVRQLAVLEADHISVFIEGAMNRLAEGAGADRQKVLVIDDLDRIDPEHIFRLFNIFSAHLDYHKTTRNKFGFDKVVFVCDVQNIRHIFHSRYGTDTDFSGYIDKFYSSEIYYFDNSEEVKQIVEDFIRSLEPDAQYAKHVFRHVAELEHRDGMLATILTELIHAGGLTLRRLSTLYGGQFPFRQHNLNLLPRHREIQNWQIPAVTTLEAVAFIVGGADALERSLQRVLRHRRSTEYQQRTERNQQYHVGTLLALLDYEQHQFVQQSQQNQLPPYDYVHPVTKQTLGYNLATYGDRRNLYAAELQLVDNVVYRDQPLDFFGLLYEAFKKLRGLGLLR